VPCIGTTPPINIKCWNCGQFRHLSYGYPQPKKLTNDIKAITGEEANIETPKEEVITMEYYKGDKEDAYFLPGNRSA
jgi:hypothetical protein